MKGGLLSFIKEWMLVIGMVAGASSYLLYHAIDGIHFLGPALSDVAAVVQPLLLFAMLFLTFCKIDIRDIRIHRWQVIILLLQGIIYTAISIILVFFPSIPHRVGLEALMLCFICPTATACAVIAGKLGGDVTEVLTYTLLINLLASVLIPVFVPLTNPVPGMTFVNTFTRILAKVFPLLILPLILATLVRFTMHRLHAVLLKYTHVSFYIWAVSLTLAMAMATRFIVASKAGIEILMSICLGSLIACAVQFWAGRKIGAIYGDRTTSITAGQVFGQKNTVFAIWLGYTFLTPVVSVAGGFYSIWHNTFNTWQLRQMEKSRARK